MKTVYVRVLLLTVLLSLGIFLTYSLIKVDLEKSIGAHSIEATIANEGDLFIAVDGNGTVCTKNEPCNFNRLDLFSKNRLIPKAGDSVFFREGIYSFSIEGVKRVYLPGGTKEHPVRYESYNKEKVVFDGGKLSRKDTLDEIWREGRLELRDSNTILRNVEVRNMPLNGIRILGNNNIVEGCKVYNNALSGIEIFNLKDGYATKATGGSFNIVRNNIVFNNTDVNLTHHNYNNGGNADGITIHSGVKNLISHNTIYGNSDDGIDLWQSMNSKIEYNLVFANGKGSFGDGYGIKLGGAAKNSPLGANAIAKHNISYNNKKSGFNINGGKNVLIKYNTAYNNGEYGYTLMDDTKLFNNISLGNKSGDFGWSNGLQQVHNSWQLKDKLKFITFESISEDFLKPIDDNISQSIGAYAIGQEDKQ